MSHRVKRYLDKIRLAENRLNLIDNWVREKPLDELVKDIKTVLAIYKAFQEVVEAIMDLIAMICKDIGVPPKDDYTNINAVISAGIIEPQYSRILGEANGLRNKIVHWYNSLDDKLAIKSINRLKPYLIEVLLAINIWLERQLEK